MISASELRTNEAVFQTFRWNTAKQMKKSEFLGKNHTITTLGIVCQHSEHCLVFQLSHIEKNNFEGKVSTKRKMLKDISKTFDTMGWLSSVTIFLEQLMQRA